MPKQPKLLLREKFYALNKFEREQIRQAWYADFGLTRKTLNEQLRSERIYSDKLIWFADKLNCDVEDLYDTSNLEAV